MEGISALQGAVPGVKSMVAGPMLVSGAVEALRACDLDVASYLIPLEKNHWFTSRLEKAGWEKFLGC